MTAAWVCAALLALLSRWQDPVPEATRLRDQGRWSEALDLLARAARQGPLAPAGRDLWLEMLLRQQDGQAAAEVAAEGLRERPGAGYLTLGLGDACWLLRDLGGAQAHYEQLLRGGGEYAGTARQRLATLHEDIAEGERAAAVESRSLWVLAAALAGLCFVAAGWTALGRRAASGSSSSET